MLKLFKKLLGKTDVPVAPIPRVIARAQTQAAPENLQSIPQVEVAHLSLLAIISKLPDELKGSVVRMPDESATVALPISTIQKQLPTGSVKMSLASLYRQSPAGTFSQARTEDRRMVEVPLPEIFRHVNPQLLNRRDQRRFDVPEDAVGLFGDTANPFALAPGVTSRAANNSPAPPAQRSVSPPADFRPAVAPQIPSMPAPVDQQAPARQPAPARIISPPPAFAGSTPGSAPDDGEPLILPIAQLAGQWPEPFRTEALSLNGTTVALPTGTVTSGLAKGKVAFSWGQLRQLMDPPAPGPTEGKDGTELLLPLKVVAPAFLAHSRPKKTRKSYDLDSSIPALFSGGTAAPAAPEAPVDEPLPQVAPAAAEDAPAAAPSVLAPPVDFAPAIAAEPEPQAAPAPEAEAVVAAPEEANPAAVEAEPLPLEAKTEVVPEPASEAPAPELPVAILETPETSERSAEPMSFSPAPGTRSTRSLGEVLGDPEKKHWSPPELVRATIKLEGVAGAIIALQEGLPVAAELPEEMKADTVAAFLPQIFARLTNYAGEMKLGAVEDILFTSAGSLFQIYRLGEVYFAVLGKPGEKLPWESLRLIAEELGGDHQK